MNKEVFFLKDSPINDWLIDGFALENFPVEFIGMNDPNVTSNSRFIRIIKLHSRYIMVALKGTFRSKNNDIIICFLDIIGLYVFIISKLLLRKREIVILNLMYNDSRSYISWLKKGLFRIMLKNNNIHSTVTSIELSYKYKKLFRLPDKNFYLLHDCYGKLGAYKKQFSRGDNYVFCGGKNSRDWNIMLKIACLLPNIEFIIVGNQKNTLGENYPSNIKYFYNISYSDFQDILSKSSIVALPLNTEAPAGLIVLFTAGLMSKPVITTDNITMREYINSGENGVLIKKGDYKKFSEEIGTLIRNLDKQKEYGEKLFKKINELGSPKSYISRIIEITRNV